MSNKQTTIALNKVAWMTYYWRTTCGCYTTNKVRDRFTVHGHGFKETEVAPYIAGYEQETLLERAKRLDIIDTWIPCLTVAFSATKHLIFRGKQATSLWQAWQAMQFGKTKKKTNEKRNTLL